MRLVLLRGDCVVLRECSRGRGHVLEVVEDGRGGSAAGVVVVLLIQRADVRRQRVWRRHVGVVDAVPGCGLHWFVPGLSNTQLYSLYAQDTYWTAAFSVHYAIVFLCLCVAKLLVLHRMAYFAVPKGHGLPRRLSVGDGLG